MGIYLVLFSFFIGHLAWSGEGLDSYSEEALSKTQNLLKDKKLRKAATQSGDAKKADDYTEQLTGHDDKLTDDIYKLSADVFQQVVKDADGDPKKMRALMDEYSRDPSAFAEKWTPEQRKKLHKLSEQVPQNVNDKN